jgi:AcrR family transcriptional regulator
MGIQQRRRREREQRRQQILNAARKLLFKNGLNAISVNQIARQAELAVGTIYFYFRSKEEIFAVLQEEGLQLLLKDVRRALEGSADARESLHNIAQAYLHFSREQKSYFDVINYFLSAGDIVFTSEIKQQIDQHGDRILLVVEQALQEGVEQGQFHVMNTRRHALLFWVILHGLIPFRKMTDTLLADDSYTALYGFAVDNFINGLSMATATEDAQPTPKGKTALKNAKTRHD